MHPQPRWLAIPLLCAGAAASGCEPSFRTEYLYAALSGPAEAIAPEPARVTDDLPPPVTFGWDSIVARDTLVAVLTFNSTGYFIHRGEPMGFEYELLTAFAADHDLFLRTEVLRDRRDLFRALNSGRGDVVASRLVASPEYDAVVGLTDPLYDAKPVVVQRAGAPYEPPDDSLADSASATRATPPARPEAVTLRARLLRRPAELAGEEVHIPAGSDYVDRIVELSDSLGETIELVEVEATGRVEPLIEEVARGHIRLTVASDNLASLSRARFENIVAIPVVGPEQPVVFAVRENAPELLAALNRWLQTGEARALRDVLYNKYFVDRESYLERTEDELFSSETGRISLYDSLFIREAAGIGWDWRLLAAQVAQESRFDPNARSWVGAQGLLQLMPRTARELGVRNPTDPEENVGGGVRYLAWLTGLWEDEIENPEERLKFILASYNAGRGHVLDAQRLAEKNGDDPTSWEDVSYWLLQKSKPSVYRDNVVRFGYVRGREPVQYVSKILERYDRYRGVEGP
ncbi:MAG TPA: transglycosylase SLT domain-containing protein [Longimicrobiales bacterium]|nr:transglycosylase SLT domain-containing protein [Longimicrobiales bacterium]